MSSGSNGGGRGARAFAVTVLALVAGIVAASVLKPGKTTSESPSAEVVAADGASAGPSARAEVPLPGPIPRGPDGRLVPGARRLSSEVVALGAPGGKGAVAGTVVDEAGKGLAGATVRARLETAKEPSGATTTAADGTYAIANLDEGTYAIEARAQGFAAETLPDVRVGAGELVRGIDFVLDDGERVFGTVLGPDGRPIEGAIVAARGAPAGTPEGIFVGRGGGPEVRGDPEGASAKSGLDGAYEVRGLTPGAKVLLASAPGCKRSEPVVVLVKAGEGVRQDFRLEKGTFIAGQVTLASGLPAPGVRVEVRAEWGGGGPMGGGMGGPTMRPNEVAEAVTGDDGRYRVEGIAGRRFRASAQSGDATVAPASRGGIKPGEEHADMVLTPGATLGGRVVTAGSGQPIEGASVSAGERESQKSARTGPGGTFELGPMPAGKHTVRASAEGKSEVEVEVKVGAGERKSDLVIELPEGGVIEGRVYALKGGGALAGATVRAIKQRGAGEGGGFGGGGGGRGGRGGPPGMEDMIVEGMAGGTDLSAFMPPGEVERIMKKNTTTDAGGRFRIADLDEGDYRVYAAHPDYPGAAAMTKLDGAGDKKKVDIGLPEAGGIFGRIVDDEGKPREGETVFAFSFMGKGRPGTSDEKGQYKVKGLAPGTYMVMLGAIPGARSGRLNLSTRSIGPTFASKQATVDMGRDTEVNFGGEPKVVVFGRVLRAGEAVPEKMINFFPDGGLAGINATTTDAEGRYEVSLLPGKYIARIDNVSEPLVIDLSAPRIERTFRLPTGSVSGRVINVVTGETIRGARVTAYKADRRGDTDSFAGVFGAIAGETRTGDDGAFRINNLAPGLYTVTAAHDGFATQRLDGVEAPPDGDAGGLELGCEPGGIIKGRALDETGAPVPGAAVLIVDAGATDLPPTGDPPRTNDEGRWEIKRFLPGRYRVTVISEQHAPFRTFVDHPGGTIEVEALLVQGATLEVSVADPVGRPVPGAAVEFRYPDGGRVITGFADFIQPTIPTGPEGKVRKGRLPAGAIRGSARLEQVDGAPPLVGTFEATLVNRAEARVETTVR